MKMKRWIASALIAMLLLAGCGCQKKAAEIELSIMSQNVRQDGASNQVDVFYRSESFIELIHKYQPDLIGLQEWTPGWNWMMEEFFEESDYEIELQYRCDWAEEATGIIYNGKRLKLLYSEHFYLSETPEEESQSWDDTFPRIATRCDFKDKETGIEFTHINTHFGLTSQSQENAGALLHDYIKENLEGRAVFLTGDMNCEVGSGGYNNIVADNLLVDSSYLADELGEDCGTFNGFEEGRFHGPIDFIFVTPERIDASYYSVLLERPNDIFISDHYGILAKCTVKR